ncbi:DUF6167 family protein [Streptomyces sp. LP05-1]|uniref:DUF6167 family protein n=1 Tax=Streptomyces pyxinae TaxID=2970734 RepID=A0ABT2CQM3_9ACTN|nr:DUF6167 family protein [Streptomyces sp. LP05-1]MCS0639723.1 DUF6167 family protein [Streptomyces sp. LP05-1]
MFRRTFWFTAGAAAGVWATTKVNRKLKALTPESLAAQAADKAVETGHRLRDFALDVRAGMAQRQAELGEALGLDAPEGGPELPPPPRVIALDPADPGRPGTSRGSRGPGPAAPNPPYTSHNRNEDH